MNKTAPILVLLFAVAGLGAILMWSGDGEPDLRPADPGRTTADVADNGSTAVGDAVLAAGGEVETADEVPPDDFLRDEVTSDDESTGRPLVVQVWLGKKGVAAPAAEVFMLDGSDSAKKESADPFAAHISTLAETRGKRFEADTEGRVELPSVEEWAILAARLPGSYGQRIIGRDHGEIEMITLRPDETVTVKVVDGKGNTVAGVPVGIVQTVPRLDKREELFARMKNLEQGMKKTEKWAQQNPGEREAAAEKMQAMRNQMNRVRREIGRADGGPPNARGNTGRGGRDGRRSTRARPQPQKKTPKTTEKLPTRPELRARRRTDENGLAVFRHFQIYRNWGDKWWPKSHHDQYQASLLMPLAKPEARPFTGRPVPEDVIELRMPDTGSLAFRTVDRDGRPFTHPVHADLRQAGRGVVPWSRVQVRKAQNEETIEFPFVGLGLQLRAICRLDDQDFRWQASRFAGPKEPGERVVVDLVVAPSEGMLFGRLFDSGGRPLADESITFLINGMAGRLEGEEVLLDRNGRFHLPYQMRPNHKPPFNLQIRRPGVVPVAGLSMPLQSLPREHVTDIGELRLDGLGVVAQGLVVDDRGMPIPGAHVQLQRERNVGREQVKMQFVEEAFAKAEADEEGRFALFGEIANARYRLHVQAKGHFEVRTPDLRNTDPQNIEMARQSRLLGTVLRPRWLRANGVRAELVLSTDPRQKREDQIKDFKGNTYVHFDWVRPGVYDLTLRVQQFPDPFLRLDRIVIEPGQMGIHPRIKNIDLSTYLYRFEIFARDENGSSLQPRRPLIARIQRPDGSTSHIGLPWQKGGRVELFSTSPQADVIPMAQGFAAEPSMVAAGRNEILFRRIPPVDVVLAGIKAMAGTTNVQVLLEMLNTEGLPQKLDAFDGGSRRIAGWYARARYSAGMVDDRDTARLQIMREGPYKLLLRFGAGQGIRPPTVQLPNVDIQLQPGSGPQRVIVNYDPQVVQDAIREAVQKIAQAKQGGE